MPKRQQPLHPFLAQMLLRYIGPTSQLCQSVNHQQLRQKPEPAEWEVRLYQNPDRVVDLYNQGVPREQIEDRSFAEACREQDTIGVRAHKRLSVCSACARFLVTHHAGDEGGFLTLATAQATNGAILLVTDRLTENGGAVGNLPGTLQEDEILPLLDAQNMLDIRFK